jgi:hypothetical protein
VLYQHSSLEGCCSTIELHPHSEKPEKSGFVPALVPGSSYGAIIAVKSLTPQAQALEHVAAPRLPFAGQAA